MVHELPLKDFWKSREAAWGIQDGWNLPLSFQDPSKEYEKACQNAGVLDLSYRGKIKVTGENRTGFLHRLLTNDIQSLAPGEGCYAAFLTATGKVLSDMFVLIFEDHILLDVEINQQEKVIGLLEKYVITEDVSLMNVTASFAHLAFLGNGAQDFLNNILSPSSTVILSPDRDEACLPDRQGSQMKILSAQQDGGPAAQFGGRFAQDDKETTPLIFILNPIPGHPKYHLWIPKDNALDLVKKWRTSNEEKLIPVGYEVSEILRMERGQLRYGMDFDEGIILSETGLEPFAVSDTKGCYPGQEVVARIKTYGGLNRRMVGLKFDLGTSPQAPLPKSGDKIYADSSEEKKEIGWITSSGVRPESTKGIAFGYVDNKFLKNKNLKALVDLNDGKNKKTIPVVLNPIF